MESNRKNGPIHFKMRPEFSHNISKIAIRGLNTKLHGRTPRRQTFRHIHLIFVLSQYPHQAYFVKGNFRHKSWK